MKKLAIDRQETRTTLAVRLSVMLVAIGASFLVLASHEMAPEVPPTGLSPAPPEVPPETPLPLEMPPETPPPPEVPPLLGVPPEVPPPPE